LPDRYVEGICPFCKAPGARGDQCDACGKPLNATELIKPYCRTCHTTPVLKESEHFFLKLSAFQEKLEKWAGEQTQWKPNVSGFTQRYLKEGLRDRAITRDIDWGVPVPVKGFEHKRLYVWFEAVIGYLSASRQWAKEIAGDSEKWHDFWDEGNGAKTYYFMGKDNIPFHTIIWPAMLMGYAGLNLPYDVPANEFLNIEGRKLSKSKHWGVWVPDYLSRYDADPLRYLLSVNMPETNDTDFSWRVFVQRNNNELVATYGNLVNRVLTFTYKNYDGKVPLPGALDDSDKALIESADIILDKVGESISRCSFRQAVGMAMSLAQQSNQYLDVKAPWKKIKEDKNAAGTALFTAINVISRLKTMFSPYLPFSSQKVHEFLGFPGKVEDSGWKSQPVEPGRSLYQPQPLFKKLDESIIEEETKRLGT
jgi:methionyl-tRNA synthetase